MESINKAVELGYDPVKVNCVVMKNMNESEIPSFMEMTRDRPIEIRFIEYMPFDGNRWSDSKFVPYKEMIRIIETHYNTKLERVDIGPNETAKTWKIPGFVGRVGFITSMTDHFCDSCNRLRLTADGNLKVCLFGNEEVSLRDMLRSGGKDLDQDLDLDLDAALLKLIDGAVKQKKDRTVITPSVSEITKTRSPPIQPTPTIP